MPDLEPNWRDRLPDDIKGDASLASFEDIGSMAKSYIELKTYQGNSLHIPGEDAGDDQRKEFNSKLLDKVPGLMLRPGEDKQTRDFYRSAGMPEKEDGYDAPEIKELPNGIKPDDTGLTFFKKVAHEAGLNKDQFKIVMKAMVEQEMGINTTNSDNQKTDIAALNKEWGAAAEERNKAAKSIAEKTKAPDGMIKALENDALPADFVAWLYSLSISIGGEGNAHNANEGGTNSILTPDEAQIKIDEIYDNAKHPFHKGDTKALKRMLDLVHLANPKASTDPNDLRRGPIFK